MVCQPDKHDLELAAEARNALPEYIEALEDRDRRIRSLEQELREFRRIAESQRMADAGPETTVAGHEEGGL